MASERIIIKGNKGSIFFEKDAADDGTYEISKELKLASDNNSLDTSYVPSSAASFSKNILPLLPFIIIRSAICLRSLWLYLRNNCVFSTTCNNPIKLYMVRCRSTNKESIFCFFIYPYIIWSIWS